ncbi:MAG: YcxB family protein [Arachidicoccus sp.]|nr:YcxB family protein [Arachidicoccus sp.]
MQYDFQYNKSKVLQALRLHFISRPEIKVLAYAVNIFAIIAAVMYGLHKIRPQAFLLCSLLWISLVIIFWFVMPNIIFRKANKTFTERFKATFNEQGITLENIQGYVHWEWEKFSNYFESGQFFHLYFNARSFFLFPKDGMSNDFIGSLRVLLNEKLRYGKY